MVNQTKVAGAPSEKHFVRVVAVTGGKGGVGKTNVSINLSIALSQREQRVLLLDADLGLANIDVLLGLKPERNLEDVYAGECELSDVIIDGPQGIRIIPASSGTQSMVQLGHQQHAGLIHAFSEMSDDIDVLVVDTAAGISDSVINFIRAAQEVLVVVCDEPSSITDAYALMKLLNRDYGVDAFRIVANQTRSEKEGRALYQRLLSTTDRFLDVMLRYEGEVPYDDSVRKAVRKQRAVMDAYPKSDASKAFNRLADQLLKWPVTSAPSGHLEFFVEQLVEGVNG
ncbi:MAG: MinD/ParA family protein [Pseudomonadales bacterium]|nr:MinD/ParA family protein [Pseudomonadales bacterium]